MSDNSNKITGAVVWFNEDRGFGFITPDHESREIFVRDTAILGDDVFMALFEGQRVEFAIVDSEKGPQAKDVVIL